MGSGTSSDVIEVTKIVVSTLGLIDSDLPDFYPDQTKLVNCTCSIDQIPYPEGCIEIEFRAGRCQQQGPGDPACSEEDWRLGRCQLDPPQNESDATLYEYTQNGSDVCSEADWRAGRCQITATPCSEEDWRAGRCQSNPTPCTEEDWRSSRCQLPPRSCSEEDWRGGRCQPTPPTCSTEDWEAGCCQPTRPSISCSCRYYDYIVIGAGTAGCVVATRLVEDGTNTVLLLEAGGDPPIIALSPGLFVSLPKTEVDYDYMSTYNPYSAGSQGNFTTFTAGKMLGGSDSLNHLVHTRGCPTDFNQWADISNEDSWRFTSFLPYFIKSERVLEDDILTASPGYHGTDGYMGLTRQPSQYLDDYLNSFNEIGHPTVLDLNADICIGYTQPQYMIANNARQTPATVYLGNVKDFPNLYVSKNTRVTKIIFKNKVAVAVEAVYRGQTYILRACKEIILCAGVFNTPQLLMLSGVGPEDHLEEMGIDLIANLPVGNNFIEQVSTTIVYKTERHFSIGVNPLGLELNLTKFPFPLCVGSVALNRSQQYPDYQTYSGLLAYDTPYLYLVCHKTFWYRPDICKRFEEQAEGSDVFYTLLANVAPLSRGTIRLKSTNPFDDPEIESNFLTNIQDLNNMVAYINDFIQIAKSTLFKQVNAVLVGLDLAECKNEEPLTDSFWRCYVKSTAFGPYHYGCSCPMGSVVDGTLRLKGFCGIRVIDGSIMPTIPKGGPNAAVVAIAEKGADIIKSTNVYKNKCRN